MVGKLSEDCGKDEHSENHKDSNRNSSDGVNDARNTWLSTPLPLKLLDGQKEE